MADRPLRRVAVIVGLAAVVSAVAAVGVNVPTRPRGMGPGSAAGLDLLLQVRVLLSTFNTLLLLALTWSYLVVYRDLPNRFTFSLVLFSVALLLYAVSSNPLVHLLFGFRGGLGLGPFTFLPDAFASVAVVTLLYQSYQ